MTVFASSNAVTLAIIEELPDGYGEVPASGAMMYLPFTGESLKFSRETISSNTINQSRQVSDIIETGYEVSGGINYELMAKNYDQLIEGVMWKRWGAATDATITATFNNTAKTIVAAAAAFANVVAGQFIQITGSNSNDGIYQIASVTSDTEVIVKSVYTLVDEVATADVTLKASMIRNPKTALASDGSVAISYFIEKALTNLAVVQRFSYSGLMVNSFSLSAQSGSAITGSFEFMGKTSTVYSTGTLSPSAIENAPASEMFNAVSHLGGVRIDGVDMRNAGAYFQGLDFTIGDSLRGLKAIGESGNIGVVPGDISVEGSMSPYFKDATFYNKMISGAEFSLSYELIKGNEGYVFSFPRCVISQDDMSAGGKDQDMVESLSWQALFDPTLQTTVQIDRFYLDYSTAPTE